SSPTIFLLLFFFFYCAAAPRHLHSFPTRRSSDLAIRDGREHPPHDLPGARLGHVRHDVHVLGSCDLADHLFVRLDHAVDHVLARSEEHTSELQSRSDLVCRLLLEKKKKKNNTQMI